MRPLSELKQWRQDRIRDKADAEGMTVAQYRDRRWRRTKRALEIIAMMPGAVRGGIKVVRNLIR